MKRKTHHRVLVGLTVLTLALSLVLTLFGDLPVWATVYFALVTLLLGLFLVRIQARI